MKYKKQTQKTQVQLRVLWVEDKPDSIKSQKGNICDAINKHDSNIEIVFKCITHEEFEYSTQKELEISVSNFLKSDLYDFLIFDFMLDNGINGINGEDLVKYARLNNEFCEILLYSSGNINESKIDKFKIRTSERSNLVKTATETLKLIYSNMLTYLSMRGGFIISAIDVENILESIIVENIFQDKGELFKDKILNKPYLDFMKKHRFLKSFLNDFSKTLENRPPQKKYLCKLVNKLSKMEKEIVHSRNMLAHSKIDENLKVIRMNDNCPEITLGINWYNKAREDIRMHKKNLMKIKKFLAMKYIDR